MAHVVLRVRNTSELDRRYFVVSPYETNELNQFFDLIQIGERRTGLTTAKYKFLCLCNSLAKLHGSFQPNGVRPGHSGNVPLSPRK